MKSPIRLLTFIALLLYGLPVSISFSQTQLPGSKINGLLQLQIEAKKRVASGGAVASDLIGTSEDITRQRVFIYFDRKPGDSEVQELQRLGININLESWIPPVGNHPAGFLIADMPINRLNDLASEDFVVRLDTAEQVNEPENDLAVIKTNVDDVWDLGYDGSGVTVAVLDSGLDVTHPDIPTPVGSWDYAEGDATIGNTVTGHGTHVTGTVLGRGVQSSGKYKGVAPGANLVFLKVGSDATGSAPSTATVNAMHDAVDVYSADIINYSYGGWDTYHDGSAANDQAVDYATSQGAAVFVSSGNDADDDQHFSSTVLAGATSPDIQVNVVGAGVGDTMLVFNLVWFDGIGTSNDLEMEIYDSTHTLLTDVTAYSQSESPRGTESQYYVYNPYVPSGDSTYYLRVINNSGVDQFFHIFYQASGYAVTFENPDPAYTVGSPATADSAISVGSYTTRITWTNYLGVTYWYTAGYVLDTITDFSSQGPRVDGGLKPSIVAPGSAIISARDRDVYPWPGGSDPLVIDNDGVNDGTGPADYYVMQGTSMASPHAAGVAALVLQARPDLVGDPSGLRSVLEMSAGNAGVHDAISGYGLIDALGSLDLFTLTVSKEGSSGTGTVTSDPAGINCGMDCSASFDSGTVVTLTAQADAGSVFSGWSGEGCGGTGECQVTMTEARTVSALFSNPSIKILLVDDDDNSPDVQSYYTDTMDALGFQYKVWDTSVSDNEPNKDQLSQYRLVIWFTGDSWQSFTGPSAASEGYLSDYLDEGGSLFISSQDYIFIRGFTSFMDSYLGLDSYEEDANHTEVTGTGPFFGGLGPYTLSYKDWNYSDRVSPDGTAELAFTGDNGDAAIMKDGGNYRTLFFAFPFEAIPTSEDRNEVMGAILGFLIGSANYVMPPSDFDGDGIDDIAVWRPSTGIWYILKSTAPGTYDAVQWGSQGDIPTPGDYDADDITDIAVWRPSTGVWYILKSTAPGTYDAVQWGSQGDIPTPGDYDADDITDIAVWRPSTGIWYLLKSSAPGTYDAVQWGSQGDIPTPGDYDADNITDIAVWRSSNGLWYRLKSSAPGTYDVVQWGSEGDIPIPGEYDLDGITDIAVWRPSTGIWYILKSSAPGTYDAVQWGSQRDIPTPGDYDGDGITDIVVWRYSNGIWYILKSSVPGTYSVVQWGSQEDIPISMLIR